MSRRYHVHLPALIYVALAVLVGIAAVNRPNNLLVWIFGLMIAALLAGGVVSGIMMLGVRMTRLDPRHGRVGEPMVMRYAVTNRNRLLGAFNLVVEEIARRDADDWSRFVAPAQAWILQVGPGETVHGEAVLWPRRRGRLRFTAVRASSAFPFGLLRKSVTARQEQETLVYPRVVALRPELLRSVVPSGANGMRMSRRSGAGEDYFGMREYKPGDSVRNIAWRRSAVLDEPVTIERTRPSPPRVRVVLNLTRATDQLRFAPGEAAAPRELEEEAISLAASLIQLASNQGYEVGLTVLGLPERPTPLRRGHWHVLKLMGGLAALDLDQPRLAATAPDIQDSERAGLIVVSPDRADPSIGGASSDILREGALHLTARQLASLRAPDAPRAGAGQSPARHTTTREADA